MDTSCSHRRLRRFGASVVVAGALGALPFAAAQDFGSSALLRPWPMFRHDARHTGRSPFVGAQVATLAWRHDTGGGISDSSAAIGRDGTIYIGTFGQPGAAGLQALNPDGSPKWLFRVDEGIMTSSPAIARDGTVYVGANDGGVYALNPNGTVKWSYHFVFAVSSSPTIAPDGTIYVGDSGGCVLAICWPGFLYAFNPNGTIKWRHPTESTGIDTSPAIGSDGAIYVGDHEFLTAFNPNGSLRWRFMADAEVDTSPGIGADGTIYFGASEYFYAVDPTGVLAWRFDACVAPPVLRCSLTSPAIAADGTIYVGSTDGSTYAIGPNGFLKWWDRGDECSPDIFNCSTTASPAIGGDGTVYVGTTYCLEFPLGCPGYLTALNPNGTVKWRYGTDPSCALAATSCGISSSPAIGRNGTVYFGADDGFVYAIGPGPGTARLDDEGID